ncbi:hypothetical protein CHUAL_007707 [Chamberlinius hualienensis]
MTTAIRIVLLLVYASVLFDQSICEVRIDCYPEQNADQSACEARGCVWMPVESEGLGASAPWCIYPQGYGYDHDGTTKINSDLGYILPLTRKNQSIMYGSDSPDVNSVYLSVEFWDVNILRLKFYDPGVARYEVPIDILQPSSKASDTNYFISYTSNPQFGISVIRNSTDTTVFNTSLPGFVFSDQFLSISTVFPSANVYGFGENAHTNYRHNLDWRVWAMFAIGNGPTSTYNLYGVQPFYMNVENDGNANGVLLLNSNAQEIVLQPDQVLTYRSIGGILDFYIFMGPKPENVVQQLTQIIGRPYFPPYWSLGFQLSRYGYKNTNDLRNVVYGMRNNSIPYDVQYVDIDYMDNRRDFSLSSNFADLPDLIDDLHEHDQHLVLILNPGISDWDPTYQSYVQGMFYDVFIKYENGTILEGDHRAGTVYYPDFSHANALTFWAQQCLYLYQNLSLEYDGLWTDVNEPTNFDAGSTSGCERNKWNNPPYVPHISESLGERLFAKTICMDAVQSGGKRHYDVHDLYGHYMAKTTFNALVQNFPERRPFLLNRSQFVGTNQYAHHWTGDNASLFEQLRMSIIAIMEYNIFGVPFVGADICGYGLNAFEELCIRWMQLGAFYPFSRNHNSDDTIAQDPPSLGQRVVNASIKALTERYRLLPYLYTLLYMSHTKGSTVARPLLHEFPTDPQTWNINYQFLWGFGLLISPVVNEGDQSVSAYFPAAKWYDYYTGNNINGLDASFITLDAPLDGNIPLHVRGGSIIPTQVPALTTASSRENPLGLLVAIDEQGVAQGLLYWDDGISYQTDVNGQFNLMQFLFDQVCRHFLSRVCRVMKNIYIYEFLEF